MLFFSVLLILKHRVPFIILVEKCQSVGGQCKILSEGCEGGSFRMGFCEPPAYRRCCIPWPNSK